MARGFVRASSMRLLGAAASSPFASNPLPFTVAAWVRPGSNSATRMTVAALGGEAGTSAQQYRIYVDGFNFRAGAEDRRDTANTAAQSASNSVLAGTSYHLTAQFIATNSRAFYINGVQQATNSGSFTHGGGTSRIAVGSTYINGAAADSFEGEIWEVGFWTGTLSTAEMAMLVQGASPMLVRPASLRLYYPLLGQGTDEPNWVRAGVLTNQNGVTVETHGRVHYYRVPELYIPASATSYELDADAGSFGALTGTAATLRLDAKIAAGAGAWAFSGTAAQLQRHLKVGADPATFPLTGAAASFIRTALLSAAAGAWSYTGTAASLRTTQGLIGEPGEWAYTGTPATFALVRHVAANAGAFAFTGTAAIMRAARAIEAQGGTHPFTGTPASFVRDLRLDAAAGSWGLTGTATQLKRDFQFTVDAGAWAFQGEAATLSYEQPGVFLLAANGGTFAGVTGTAATLSAARILTAQAGAHPFTGTATTLRRSYMVTAQGGAFNLTGTPTAFYASRTLQALAGSIPWTVYDVALATTQGMQALAGAWAWTGVAASLRVARVLPADPGAWPWTAADIRLYRMKIDPLFLAAGSGRAFVAAGSGRRFVAGN
jgi:hypothetical protein